MLKVSRSNVVRCTVKPSLAMIYNITFGLFFLGCAIWVTVRGITFGWTSGDVPILILMVACLFEKVIRVIEIRRDRLHPPSQRRSEDDVTPFAKGESKPHDRGTKI
jgi:hypothetical protein